MHSFTDTRDPKWHKKKSISDEERENTNTTNSSMFMEGYLNDAIAEQRFNMGDFICSRSSPTIDVSDIRDILEVYVRQNRGEVLRKKYFKSKVDKIENALTPRGLKKLNDARKGLRIHMENANKYTQRCKEPPNIQKDPLIENYGFDDGPQPFILKMHNWGKFPLEDCRYYLHMVFRYFFKEYHDSAVAAGVVLEHPSYQFILDHLYPNDSANKFPPEFRRFLVDSSKRYIKTVSLPVPEKGSATNVEYGLNFEHNLAVCAARQKIQWVMTDWKRRLKNGDYEVYPPYLLVGNEMNSYITERLSFSCKVKEILEQLHRLEHSGVDESSLDKILLRCPKAGKAYGEYTSHRFKSGGEQLNERMGFFMRPGYRQIFYAIEEEGIEEDLFKATGSGMEVFLSFQAFCSPKKHRQTPMPHEKEEGMKRYLLMTIVDVCSLFYAFTNRATATNNSPGMIIRDAISRVTNETKTQTQTKTKY